MQNTSLLTSSLNGVTVTCPAGHGTGQTCKSFSVPLLANDVIFDNRTFYIGVGALGGGTLNQQNVVALYNAFTTTPAVTQPTVDATTANGTGAIITGGTGACVNAVSYWDIGVRGDTGPTNHGSGLTLAPTYSVMTSITGYNGATLHNTTANPTVLSQYCNGSRTPPEFQSLGYQVPPGISDATVPNPVFNLTPAATVDEGNNWINLSWGPLAETNAVTGAPLGNYGPASTSSVINYIPSTAATYAEAPTLDFYGTNRKANHAVDAGAVEFTGGAGASASLVARTPDTGAFGNWVIHNPSTVEFFIYTNTGTTAFTTTTVVLSDPTDYALTANGCANEPLNPGQTCTVGVIFTPSQLGALPSTLTVNGPAPASINLTGTGIAPTATLVGTLPQPFPANFGSVVEGQVQPVQQIYTYTNTSAGNYTITGTTLTEGAPPVSAADFSVAFGNCTNGKVLSPGNSCTIQVQFNPHSTGVINATLTVTGPAPQSVTLTGTGLYAPSTVTVSNPNPLLTAGGSSQTAVRRGVVTVRNTGPGIVSLTAVPTVALVTGTGTFVTIAPATGTPCTATTTLASGAACTMGVQYTPPAAGSTTATARVSVTDTGAGAAPATAATQSSAIFTGN
jgi:hypothetical protein